MPARLRLAPKHSSWRRFLPSPLPLLTAAASLWLASCDVFDRDLGDNTVGSSNLSEAPLDSLAGGWSRDSISANLQIFASPQTLKAGHRDQSDITVRVFDRNHNPLSGQVVRFAAERGGISARDTTDDQGEAHATFSPIAQNTDIRLLAGTEIDGKMQFTGLTISLRGVSVRIKSNATDTLVGKAIPLEVLVTDGDGEAVSGAKLSLEGAQTLSGVTDGSGILRTTVTRNDIGTVRVRASALGAADSLTVGFFAGSVGTRNSNLSLYVDPGRIAAAEGATGLVNAILYDDRHNPVVGKTIAFSASHGRIGPSAQTDEKGVATVTFFSTSQNVDVTVSATASLGDSLKNALATVSLTGLTVAVQPATQDALLNDSITLTVRVKDGLGKPVADAPVVIRNASPSNGRTNASGLLTVKSAAATEQMLVMTASALGAADTVKLFFWKNIPKDTLISRPSVGNLRIFVEPPRLLASNTDEGKVRVVAFDALNNPIAGRQVRFTANAGIITQVDTTDARGEATATLRAVPINTNARVTATMSVEDSSLSVATVVTFEGLRVEVLPSVQNAVINTTVPVTLRLTDGAGVPVPDATIFFGDAPSLGKTNGAGLLQTALTSGSQRRVTLKASALGAVDSGFVDFWTVLPGKPQIVDSIRELRIFSSRSQLRADNSDFAVITVILSKDGNNPAVGETIKFSSNLGIIGSSAVIDSAGRAQITLRSVPINGTCRVTATAVGRNLSASTEVLFSGVALQLLPVKTDFKIGEDAVIDAFLKDGSGNPIGGDAVNFTASGASALFSNDLNAYTVTLNPLGQAQVRVRSATAGPVKVKALSLNTADSVTLRFSNNTLTLATDKSSLGIAGNDSVRITATYVDGNNNAVVGTPIRFATTAGLITVATVNTDNNGRAVTYLKAATFSGMATVQATAAGGTAQTQIAFNAGSAAKVTLEITPDNIAVNGGLATLRAIVVDAQGNRISGQDVSFRILQGPGGGETIVKPVSQAQSGVALSQLQAGTVPSTYRGVSVEVRVGTFADTSKLTLSGPARTITISRPEDDSITVPKGGNSNPSTFAFNVGAVVQDINGNPVADGTEIHFSAVVTGMAIRRLLNDGWTGLGTSGAGSVERKPRYKTFYQDIPFEDINNNKAYDPGIDLNIDFDPTRAARGEDINGDGQFDWSAIAHTYWYDFNNNGICDSGIAEDPNPFLVPLDSVTIYHDLNNDGQLNPSEVIGGGSCNDQPASGDFPYHFWETRRFLANLPFTDNDFAVVIPTSAVTKGGIAEVQLSYPRQVAQRLFVTVNAEVNGIRDKDGERFILPKIVGQ